MNCAGIGSRVDFEDSLKNAIRCLMVAAACSTLLLLQRGALRGQEIQGCAPFSAPRRITDGSGMATQTAIGLDIANNAYISSVINEKIKVKIIGPALDVDIPVASDGLGQADPDFANTPSGVTYMCFSQINESTPGEGREIYLTNNQGGGGKFHDPVNVSKTRAGEYAPRLVLDRLSQAHLVWAQRVGEEQPRVMYLNTGLGGGAPVAVVQGDYPHLFVHQNGVVHLVYSRLNDLYYNNNSSGTFSSELRVTTTAKEPESSASIGADPLGNVMIAFESRQSLYYATKSPGAGFGPPLLIDAGGVLNPRMRVRSQGQVAIAYAKNGDIYYVVGQSSFLSTPQRVCVNPGEVGGRSHPSIEIDPDGNIHVSFIRNGEVYYINTAQQPAADFSAIPTVGEVPLTVRFGDLSSGGGIQVWEWDFGDGMTSDEQNPVHTYTRPDKYNVSLRVSGPGGVTSQKEKLDFVFAQDASYMMRIPDQRVFPGQQGVWFPVITSRKEKSQGFQMMVTYDPDFLAFKGVEFANTLLQSRAPPEFHDVLDHGAFVAIGCIYDYAEPFDKTLHLPAGENQVLQQLVFDVSGEAPQGARTRVDLVNNYSISRIFNIFIVNGFTKLPALQGSTVEIIVGGPPYPRLFLRGDVDSNGKIELTDAVRTLNYLFTGGTIPDCIDSADVNDTGKVDISSAVAILSYLFTGGGQPSVPFPSKGLDPTPDNFPDCY